MSKAQISMWEEKIVDSFAGGGGASTDIMLACAAIGYVAEFAADKCRFIPLPGGGQK